jgi:hypothetical protein
MPNNQSQVGANPNIGGAKRKNGHKSECKCHICENIKNKAKRGGYEEDLKKQILKKMGGSHKKNGHKPDCECPICINMKNSKVRNNEDSSIFSTLSTKDKNKTVRGKKRGNGHKVTCECPICKNIMKSKNKKGGDLDDNISSTSDNDDLNSELTKNEITADDKEYETLDNLESSDVGLSGGKHKKMFSRKKTSRKNSKRRNKRTYTNKRK